MARPPLSPLVLGSQEIPLALPKLALRMTLLQTWAAAIPEGADSAPLAIANELELAALGMCWEAGGTPVPFPTLRACGSDLARYAEGVGEALEAVEGIDLRAATTRAGDLASDVITSLTPPKAAAVQAAADFSVAEPAPASSPASTPPIAGSATPSAGAT